jgi:hypothetical protein
MVGKRIQNFKLVVDTLSEGRWIRDISGSLSVTTLVQFINLWNMLHNIQLNAGIEDKFIWKWTTNQQYFVSSTYPAFLLGQCAIPGKKELSKARAPPRCKFFIWTVLLDRCWTSERLQRHSLQNNGLCALCSQAPETIVHLLLSCAYSKEVWFVLLPRAGFHHLAPSQERSFADRWLLHRKQVHKDQRKGFDSFVVLVSWHARKERNARIFDKATQRVAQLVACIREEGQLWITAGLHALSDFLQSLGRSQCCSFYDCL